MAKEYSLDEISKHCDNRSSWITIHNNIYDVTAFLNEHPGGEEVLLEQAGKDASEAFEDVGHSSDARELMKKYKIGEVVESERKPINEKGSPKWNSASNSDQTPPSDAKGGSCPVNCETFASLRSWIVPVTLGIVATILYRYYFPSH